MYHYVRNVKKSRYPNLKALEFKSFKKQICFLIKILILLILIN